MKIAVGSDHRGLEMKNDVTQYLGENGLSYRDFGAEDETPVDYPDVAQRVAEAVSRGDFDLGILICGTGIGMSMAANKVSGVRAALCCDAFMAMRARQHNDANLLCLGADRPQNIGEILHAFLTASFEGGRHQRRIEKLRGIENSRQSRFA